MVDARCAARTACAHVAALRRDHAVVRAMLDPLLAAPGLETDTMFWDAVEIAARAEGDRAAAESAPAPETRLAPIRSAAASLPRDGPYLTARWLQAEADLARARHADTPDIWAEVATAWESVDHLPGHGWACLRLAEAHVRAADKSAATDPLAQALRIASQLGATGLRDAAVGLALRARVPLTPELRTPASQGQTGSAVLARLTERELEVLRHVASGMSNNEVAAALFISPKTASVHVSRILAKLGVTTRAKATALAIEEGFTPHRP